MLAMGETFRPEAAMEIQTALWSDRGAAGRDLAAALAPWRHHPSAVVIGLPRGGVAVAAEVARSLGLPLATWAVRKIGHPLDPECAIGAVAPGGVVLWDRDRLEALALTPRQQRQLVDEQVEELRRRQEAFGDPPAEALRGRLLIVVDDGIATGLTVRAALISLAQLEPDGLILAVPVVEASVVPELEPLVESLVALARVEGLRAVGLHYLRFEQLGDDDVTALLKAAGRLRLGGDPRP
jgi:putative phosphoribosyl transferase